STESAMHRTAFVAALAASLLLAACQISQPAAHDAPATPAGGAGSTPGAPPAPPAPTAPFAHQARLDGIEATGARSRQEAKRGVQAEAAAADAVMPPPQLPASPVNREDYADLDDNPVRRASEHPVSTFSVDVDTVSYSNVRRMLRDGVRPPP